MDQPGTACSRRKTSRWIVFTLVILISACSGAGQKHLPPATAETPASSGSSPVGSHPDAGDAKRGAVIFVSGQGQLPSCSTCHSTGHNIILGPGLGGISKVAHQRVSGQSAVDYLHSSIVDPEAFIVPGFENIMPSFFGKMLSDQDVADLIAYLLTLP